MMIRRNDYLRRAKDMAEKSRPDESILSNSSVANTKARNDALKIFRSREFLKRCKMPNEYGHPMLQDAITNRYGVSRKNILVNSSASSSVFLACKTILKPGDEVILEHPYYQPLFDVPDMLGAGIKFWKRNEDGSLNLDELQNLITNKTKLIILTNLHNPLSYYISITEMCELDTKLNGCGDKIKVLVDEVYHELAKPGIAFNISSRFITVSSLSKSLGLNSLQCGWIIGDESLINDIRQVHLLTHNIGSIYTEAAASIILDKFDTYLQHSKSILSTNREILREYYAPLREKGILKGDIPEYGSTFFPSLNIDDENKALEVIDRLEAWQKIVPGYYFDVPASFRIGLGGDSSLFEEKISGLAHSLMNMRL